ncbi:MAG: GerAB/ArcD/ProY family transporter [Oscillospiraceae bacterium]|nr:GerAB/ArcD/ProY family transporter [Oscillospiraceae bacterium]
MNSLRSQKLIDDRQLLMLLFLGRMFSMMTYSPGKEAVPGTVTLAAQPLALLAEAALLLPAFWVLRRCKQDDLLGAVYRKNRFAGHFCAVAAMLVCQLESARTITVQTDFLTGTIYRLPNRMGLLLALWAGILYAVWLGLESFARLSMGVFVVFVFLEGALAVQALPHIDLINLHNPLEQGFVPILQGAALSVGRCGELAAALLLIPAVRGKAIKQTAVSALLWTLSTAFVSFLVLTALGNFAALRSFPVYALALAGGEGAVFGRLDALMLLVWIFLAVIRGGMFQWLAARCVFLISGRGKAFCIAASGAGSLLMAVFSHRLGQGWESPLLWGICLLSVAVGIPLLATLFPHGGKKP